MEEYERVLGLIADFVANRNKSELFKIALERGVLIAPINTISDVLESPQLESRNYWQILEHPELQRSFPYPGPFVRFSETPIAYRRRPPLVGEHNREIFFNELGLSENKIKDLERRGII
jgi:crotonobetainyl-CoA:carnitine CoA-transferase CaiB-like acyl-CoA transferase